MTKRLTYTPLNVKGIRHYGPPDPDGNSTVSSLDVSPAARRGGRVPTTARKRRGYARSASERKERRRERRAHKKSPSRRRGGRRGQAEGGRRGDDDKEDAAGNRAVSAGGAAADGGAASSPEMEFDVEGDETKVVEDDAEDSDVSHESNGATDWGGVTEFRVDENNDDDHEDTVHSESEDDSDSEVVQRRLFPSTSKKRRVIVDEEEDFESAMVRKENTLRSKLKGRVESRKSEKSKSIVNDDSSYGEAALDERKKKTPASCARIKRSEKTEPTKSGREKNSAAEVSTPRSKKASSAKACSGGQEDASTSKANLPKRQKASFNNKEGSSGMSAAHSKSSSVMNSFVRAAEEALAATEAAELLAAEYEAAKKKSREKNRSEKKGSKSRRSNEFDFEEELEENTFDSSDNEASEYNPTQEEGKNCRVVEKSPRPIRHCSSLNNKMSNNGQPSLETAADAKASKPELKDEVKKARSFKVINGNEEKSFGFEDASHGAVGDGGNAIPPISRKNHRKKAKSSKINQETVTIEKDVTMEIDDDGWSNDTPNTADLEVEYHEADGADNTEKKEGICGPNMLLTQAAASQFMQQSFGSSIAEEERNKTHASGIREIGRRRIVGGTKMRSIVLSTRDISKKQPNAPDLTLADKSGSDILAEAEDNKSSPGKFELTESSKMLKNNFASSIKLTTRGISNVHPDSFLAAIQTQPQTLGRSQQSAVSPETEASMAENRMWGTEPKTNGSEESHAGDATTDKMSPEEVARSLRKMGHHVSEIQKILKRVSYQFGVSGSESSTA